jgi:hypothetical protein
MTIAEEFATRNFSKAALAGEREVQLANRVLQVFTDNGKQTAYSMPRTWSCYLECNGLSLSKLQFKSSLRYNGDVFCKDGSSKMGRRKFLQVIKQLLTLQLTVGPE